MRAREVERGESHSHPYHVDIRVGIMNSLECVFSIACALRWGVIHVGDYHYWALLTPSWDSPFQVQGVFRKTTLTRGHF